VGQGVPQVGGSMATVVGYYIFHSRIETGKLQVINNNVYCYFWFNLNTLFNIIHIMRSVGSFKSVANITLNVTRQSAGTLMRTGDEHHISH